MSQTVITTAFEQLKAQQAANGGVLTLDEFVFANIPNLNITDPIDRAESWPAANQIVYRQAVSKTGMVNNNAVVYSVVLGADVGDFEFNWVGLINKASNTVAMIVHAPVQKKIKTASGQQGNVLTRSFLMEYDGASQQTQIITPVDTWQIDFTARLGGVDERQRQENIDVYGAAAFLGNGWLVTKMSSTKFSVQSGVGYIAGLRAELLVSQDITVNAKPTKIWVDVCWRGTLTSAWSVVSRITVTPELENYSENGELHYVFAIAEINADGTVTDLRQIDNLTARKFNDLPEKYLSRKKPFADIKQDGEASVQEALSNLDLLNQDGSVGRLLKPQRPSVSGVYNPTPGARFVLVKLQAAGGNGANAAATASGQVACGTGGSAGAYAEFLVNIADITDFNFTIGLPAALSSSATQGGSTSFCGVTCSGGRGHSYAVATSTSSPFQTKGNFGGEVTDAGTTKLLMLKSKRGSVGGNAISTVAGNAVSGYGGDSEFYSGSLGVGGGSSNGIDAKDGAGGSGANGTSNPAGGFSGGLGGNGAIEFWEFA